MEQYAIPLMPGPVSIPADVLAATAVNYGSPDTEPEFFDLYGRCEIGLKRILNTQNQVAILSGEGMLALWSALKSVIRPGDKVLAIGTGVFGYGVGEMARQIGATVEFVKFEYDESLDLQQVREAARRFQPKLVTAIHCETPSGILNPIDGLGEVAHEADALLYVDFVASAGGAPLEVDTWGIDLGLLGSQKVLSCTSDLSMVSLSERAWAAIDEVQYVGYDALVPWQTGVEERYLPYTHNWHSMAGLDVAINRLLSETVEGSIVRHQNASAYCIERLQEMGVKIFPRDLKVSSPTVTAAYVPDTMTWRELDKALRSHGMIVGGSYGPLTDKVFRIGHMGSQAEIELVERGMDGLASVLP